MRDGATRARLTTLALAMGAFAIGTSEFAAMGLLPYFAADFAASEPEAGHAISAYALGVVVGAPLVALLARGVAYKPLLTGLIALFAVTNLAGAMMPELAAFTATRFLAGLPHAGFLGIATLYVADLLPPERRAQSAARVIMGLTTANVLGVPAASALGQGLGWQAGFLVVAAIATASALMLRRVAPADAPRPRVGLGTEMRALADRAVWLALGVGAIGFGGVFAVYAYLSAAMLAAAEAPAWSVPLALAAFGVGATAGSYVVGLTSGRAPFATAVGCLVWLLAALGFYAAAIESWPATILAAGLVGGVGGLVIPLQVRLMDVAGAAQSLAASLNHAAFNVANALGPFLAGLALEAGMGWRAPAWVGLGLTAAGLALCLVAWLDARRGASGALAGPARA